MKIELDDISMHHLQRLLNHVTKDEWKSFIASNRDPGHVWNDISDLWLLIEPDGFIPLSCSYIDGGGVVGLPAGMLR